MTIIVTGGAGFLGSHLCEKLLENEEEVICIDNLITGSEDNVSHLKNNPNFKFIEADASWGLPEGILNQRPKGGRVVQDDIRQIYHMASPASPNKNNPKSYIALPFERMQLNWVPNFYSPPPPRCMGTQRNLHKKKLITVMLQP